MEYQITIGIEAENEPKALAIANALVDIKNILSENDLVELAKILKKKPSIIKTAKKFLG